MNNSIFLYLLKSFIISIGLTVMVSCTSSADSVNINGYVFGTTYSVQYYQDDDHNFEKQFDSIFYIINRSLSTYQSNSIISRLNRYENVLVDDHFLAVLKTSQDIYKITNGKFDPTIGLLVNAWDFGPEEKIDGLDSLKIDSLMQFVGFNKVNRINRSVLKPKGTYLDFNAIAKGYAVDVISDFLETKKVENYLIEIGGELRSAGRNLCKDSPWNIGVETPRFDGDQSVLMVIPLIDQAMATSGTYRKFKTDQNGNRYAHIFDTESGYPSKTNLLSVSVIAENCMTADAYATAFQAMEIEAVESVLKEQSNLMVFLIFENDAGALETRSLNGFPEGQ